MQFSGKIQAKMDAKGRLFFPADFRRQADADEEKQCYVLKQDAFQPCLVIYPHSSWEQEVEELRSRLNRWNPKEAMLFRQFLSDVEVFTLDANGRFIVPRRFQPLLGTERKAVFLGLDDRIELWDAARTTAPFLSTDEFTESLQQLMSKSL